MPRVTAVQTNFTAGELSPRLYGRVEIDRYHNGAKVLENVVIYVHGGVARRPGLAYLARAKHDNKRAVLIPYVFNDSQAYMLEVGDAYIRVFTSDGQQVQASPGVPYEVPTTYAEADLPELDYCQSADTMLLTHGDYVTSRLRRYGDAAWVFDAVPWIVQPFDEVGTSPDLSVTIDAVSVAPQIAFTVGSDTFRDADVGRQIISQGGVATITATSSTIAIADVITPFPSATLAPGTWTIDGSPQTTLTPSVSDPVGRETTLTLSAAGWRPDDVGKFVDVNGGLVQITAVSSATVATGIIHRVMTATVAAAPYSWILQGRVWGGYSGHPRTGTFFEQRLWLAGSPGHPQTVWGSRIGQAYNMELGTLATDAVSFDVASEQANPIVNLTQLDVLVPLTYGGEFTMRGGNDQPITPTNVAIKQQSNFGSRNIPPERVGNELVFVQRGGRKVRAMSADKINTAQYGAPDLTVLAEHITKSGVVGLAYQAEPDSLLYCLRADGVLATCTIDRDQDVIGWARQVTAGAIESVAKIPAPDGDQVWVLVRRTINGATVRTIERFDASMMTDCATVQTDAVGKAAWTGLDHLEGCAVAVKADGVAMQNRTVSGGAITIERAAKLLEVGLPYTCTVAALRPELQGTEGSVQASNMRVSEVTIRVLDTVGATINGAPAFARQAGLDVLDAPPPLETGDVMLETLGWDIGQWNLVIEQPQPYPFHLQAIIAKLTVNP